MKNKYITSILTICMVSLFLCGTVCAEKITVEDIKISTLGQKVEIPVLLDSAPEGIAEYEFIISLDQTGIAQISEIIGPSEYPIFVINGTPGEKVSVGAADLLNNVEPGTDSLELCKIVIEGFSEGITKVNITEFYIMDDSDNVNQFDGCSSNIIVETQNKDISGLLKKE